MASKRKTYDQLHNEFLTYHEANPRVYQLVNRFAQEAISRGYYRYAIATIWERIRSRSFSACARLSRAASRSPTACAASRSRVSAW